ncbi:hypothetical protein FIBSPDRAFT_551907 [Athelia psychrophila]|uniref:Uncharacterized protein n=1 Tax=Athelia psychrophila TaxID=1759441 RepID=A0A166UVL8_9AGAM|nr:hypothetical protein FIBSPDRAFT_551907 [Fibularhizoctonia sp. CBS 109695]
MQTSFLQFEMDPGSASCIAPLFVVGKRASKYALASLKPTPLLIPARLPYQAPQTPIPNAHGPLQNSICHHFFFF